MENGVGGRKRKFSNKSSRTSTSSDHKLFADSKVFSNKTVKEPVDLRVHNNFCNKPGIVIMDSNASTHGSDYSSIRDCRKMVLEQMYQSLHDSEGGLQDCIRDALAFDLQGSCRRRMKESVQFSAKMHSGNHNGCKDHAGICSYGLRDESVCTNTDLCKRALFHVLISTKFAELCDLLFVNFQGPKVNCLFDFSLINSRIKEGAYESSPMLFQSDLEQTWTKVQQIGTEMIILAKSLSKKSIVSSSETLLVQDFHGLAKLEQTEGSCQYNVCTCSLCEEKAVSSDCLICDYCEEIYHVSCIEPSVQKIPLRTWYCSSCKRKGIGSSHENCLLCESINLPRSVIIGIDGLVKNERELELEESLDDLGEDMPRKEEETLPKCKICAEHLGNEKFRQCGQPFCLSKYYHMRCLTVKELNYNSSCWYCPSCLCRVCLTDQDNDKLLLCDGCDQAFHLYCLQPPCASIPTGNWFCGKCDEGMQRLVKVKRAYENTLRGGAKKVKGAYENPTNMPKDTGEDLQDKSGGVDILLTS